MTAADLRLPQSEALVGKYLLRDVKAGEAIMPELLTGRAPGKLPDASLAAVVTVAASEVRKIGLGRGMRGRRDALVDVHVRRLEALRRAGIVARVRPSNCAPIFPSTGRCVPSARPGWTSN